MFAFKPCTKVPREIDSDCTTIVHFIPVFWPPSDGCGQIGAVAGELFPKFNGRLCQVFTNWVFLCRVLGSQFLFLFVCFVFSLVFSESLFVLTCLEPFILKFWFKELLGNSLSGLFLLIFAVQRNPPRDPPWECAVAVSRLFF